MRISLFIPCILLLGLTPACINKQRTKEEYNQLYRKKNPGHNKQPTIHPIECVHTHSKAKSLTLSSLGNTFQVFYLENSPPETSNPNFPSIHITTNAQHNAWLHLIRTDSPYQEYQEFIDADPKLYAYPFYVQGSWGFCDAPSWDATYYEKPVSYWHGHAYAVFVDDQSKVVTCAGGVQWGYTMPQKSWGPRAIKPSALGAADWNEDKKIFIKELSGYSLK